MHEEAQQPNESVRIIADHRECSGQVVQCLQSMDDVQLAFQQLKAGDYRVADWLFERKTLPDLAASIIDGRLFRQAYRLAGSSAFAAIILEGTGKDLASVGMHRNAMQGALISLALVYCIPILRSRCPEETARLLVFAGRQLRRESTKQSHRCGRRPKRHRRLQLHVLQGLPGIGPGRAAALLDHFGTVRQALAASAEELCGVPGISRVTAEKMEWVLGQGEHPWQKRSIYTRKDGAR
jgi:DNA excision repair protein ERCC-4